MPSFLGIYQCSALVALASFASLTSAHSWVEQLTVISPDGKFTGAPGYPRGNVLRTAPNFGDPLMVNLLPPNGRAAADGILKTDLMCKDSQKSPVQTDGSPILQAAPGSLVALRYQENGHVTLPQNQPGKPENRGNVSIYGTTQPSETDTLLGIHKQWNAEGTGGDKRGKLLATQAFDDGQCYQVNGGQISAARQGQFPHQADKLMGADLWCQNDIKIPVDAPNGKPYTLYWVWDWPTAPSVDPGLPKGKAEVYTTCMDVAITTKPNTKRELAVEPRDASADNSINNMAVPQYMKELTQGQDASAPETAAPQTATQQTAAPRKAPSSTDLKALQLPTLQPTLPNPAPITVTVTQSASADQVTVTVTVPSAIAPTPATTSTPPLRSIESLSGTASALPVATSSTNSTSPSQVARCNSCKVHKRSRIFGSAHKFRGL